MKSAYELKVISQQAAGQRSAEECAKSKHKKSEILMRYSLQGRIGRPQNPKRLAAHLTDTFAYHLGDAKIMR